MGEKIPCPENRISGAVLHDSLDHRFKNQALALCHRRCGHYRGHFKCEIIPESGLCAFGHLPLLFYLLFLDYFECGGFFVPRKIGKRKGILVGDSSKPGHFQCSCHNRSLPVLALFPRFDLRGRYGRPLFLNRFTGFRYQLPHLCARISEERQKIHPHLHSDFLGFLYHRGFARIFLKSVLVIKT